MNTTTLDNPPRSYFTRLCDTKSVKSLVKEAKAVPRMVEMMRKVDRNILHTACHGWLLWPAAAQGPPHLKTFRMNAIRFRISGTYGLKSNIRSYVVFRGKVA